MLFGHSGLGHFKLFWKMRWSNPCVSERKGSCEQLLQQGYIMVVKKNLIKKSHDTAVTMTGILQC